MNYCVRHYLQAHDWNVFLMFLYLYSKSKVLYNTEKDKYYTTTTTMQCRTAD